MWARHTKGRIGDHNREELATMQATNATVASVMNMQNRLCLHTDRTKLKLDREVGGGDFS